MKENEYSSESFSNDEPKVTVVMVMKSKTKLLKDCIYIIENTAYGNYKILIVDTESEKIQKSVYLKSCDIEIEIISCGVRNDFSDICNKMLEKVDSEYTIFFDTWIESINPNWLSNIIESNKKSGSIFKFSNGNIEPLTRGKTRYDKKLERKLKMLMIGHNLNLEGAPFSQFELTKGLMERGNFEIEVYCPQDGTLRNYYENIGVKVNVFGNPLKNIDSMIKYEIAINSFSNWIKSNSYDIVYANTLLSFYGIDAAERAGIPSIWNIRESSFYKECFNYLPKEIRHKGIDAFKYSYSIIFVAQATRALYEDLNANKRFKVINNGLKTDSIKSFCKAFNVKDSKKALGIDDGKKMVLIIGTVSERKGQIDFVKAAIEYIEQGNKDAYFYIVGGRKSLYLNKIMESINNNKAKDFIKVVMETSDTYQYFRAADLFICCSYNESYPRVVLEAMAFELPIITTPVFGIREQVKENINALIYKPGDVKTLETHLKCLLKDDNMRGKLARNSLDVFKNINSYEEMVEAYEKELMNAWKLNINKSH